MLLTLNVFFFFQKEENCASNNVSFVVLLSPSVENARKPRITPRKGIKENLDKQQLEEKQKAAEERRKVGIVIWLVEDYL